MVKLIALDLDRTTLTSDGHLSEANKRALSGAIKRGVHVCIASGRAFDTLPEEVLNVKGIEYAITSNGASVYRIADRKCIKSYILKPQSVDNVLSVCKQYPVTYEAFIRGCAYAAKEYIDNPVKYGATGINNLYVIFDRDIVIGGFVSRYLLEYEENIRQRLIDKYSFDTDGRYFSISSCTSERTDTGAAIMFLSEFINSI